MMAVKTDGRAAGAAPARGRIQDGVGACRGRAVAGDCCLPKRPSRPGVNPESCSRLSRRIGAKNVWQTSFVGQRQGPSTRWRAPLSSLLPHQEACKAWLYRRRPTGTATGISRPCKEGIQRLNGKRARRLPAAPAFISRRRGLQRPAIAFSYISST
jgi:hypothetical protein